MRSLADNSIMTAKPHRSEDGQKKHDPQIGSEFSNYDVTFCHILFAPVPLAYPSPRSRAGRGSVDHLCVKLPRKWDDQLQMTRQEHERDGE